MRNLWPGCTCGEGNATLHLSNCGLFDPPKPTGICPVCGRSYQLKGDGILRTHWKRDGMPFSDHCDGSGTQPNRTETP